MDCLDSDSDLLGNDMFPHACVCALGGLGRDAHTRKLVHTKRELGRLESYRHRLRASMMVVRPGPPWRMLGEEVSRGNVVAKRAVCSPSCRGEAREPLEPTLELSTQVVPPVQPCFVAVELLV